jgi:hypothetical protein
MISYALYGYQTSVRTSTKLTPYSQVYEMEVVMPLKVKILHLKELKEVESEWARLWYE